MTSIQSSTCIRFRPRQSERDYLGIYSRTGYGNESKTFRHTFRYTIHHRNTNSSSNISLIYFTLHFFCTLAIFHNTLNDTFLIILLEILFVLCYSCSSFIGRTGGEQAVSLQRRGCLFLSIVQHEFLHALGFHHEHQRSDRDNHVQILLQNVQTSKSNRSLQLTDSLISMQTHTHTHTLTHTKSSQTCFG